MYMKDDKEIPEVLDIWMRNGRNYIVTEVTHVLPSMYHLIDSREDIFIKLFPMTGVKDHQISQIDIDYLIRFFTYTKKYGE